MIYKLDRETKELIEHPHSTKVIQQRNILIMTKAQINSLMLCESNVKDKVALYDALS